MPYYLIRPLKQNGCIITPLKSDNDHYEVESNQIDAFNLSFSLGILNSTFQWKVIQDTITKNLILEDLRASRLSLPKPTLSGTGLTVHTQTSMLLFSLGARLVLLLVKSHPRRR